MTINSTQSGETWEEEFGRRFFNPSIPYPNELKNFIRSLLISERAAIINELSEYTEHERDCILSMCHSGRPTEDGGYENLYGKKWYRTLPVDETPPCECGLSELLKEPR